VGKRIEDGKMACSGAGAAALACLDLLVHLGLRREHVLLTDSKGLVYKGRKIGMVKNKARYANETATRSLADIVGADTGTRSGGRDAR